MKKTQEIKLMIIENFIDHIETNEVQRNKLKVIARQYAEEDHVDEIGQSFSSLSCESEIIETKPIVFPVGSFNLVKDKKDEWKNETGRYLIVNMGNEFQAFDLFQAHNPEDSVIASDEDFDGLVEKIFKYNSEN